MGTVSGMNYNGVNEFRSALDTKKTNFLNIITNLQSCGDNLALVYTSIASDAFRAKLNDATGNMEKAFKAIIDEFSESVENYKKEYGLRDEELEAQPIVEFDG